jgi:predicted amino acid racemase
VGKLDARAEYLVPLDPNPIIHGDTSDCLIADITDCEHDYQIGDLVLFRPKYHSLLGAMNSLYVKKIII